MFKGTTHFGKEEIWSYFDRNKQVSCECKLLLITIENYKAKTVNRMMLARKKFGKLEFY